MKHEAAACCCIEKITAASGRTAAARPKSKTSKKGQYKSGFEKLPQVMRHSLRLIWMAEHIHGSDFGGGLRILPLANICKEDRVSRRPHSATDWSWLAHYVLNYAIGSSANFCNFFRWKVGEFVRKTRGLSKSALPMVVRWRIHRCMFATVILKIYTWEVLCFSWKKIAKQ